MARKRYTPNVITWTFSKKQPLAVANARVLLALVRLVRRVRGGLEHGKATEAIGALLPVLMRMQAKALRSIRDWRAENNKRYDKEQQEAELDSLADELTLDSSPADISELGKPVSLLDWGCHSALAHAWVYHHPAANDLFLEVEATLEQFVASTNHPTDSNILILREALGLNVCETAFLKLMTAFLHTSVDRQIFNFPEGYSKIVPALAAILKTGSRDVHHMCVRNARLVSCGLWEKPGHGEYRTGSLDSFFEITSRAERLLSVRYESMDEMSNAILAAVKRSPEQLPLTWPHLAGQEKLLKRVLLHALDKNVPGINVLLYGEPGTGKTEFARQIIGGVNGSGFLVSNMDEEGEEASRKERLQSLGLCQIFATGKQRSVLLLDEAEDIFQQQYGNLFGRVFGNDRETKAWMNKLLEQNKRPVIWISNQIHHLDPAYLRRFTYCIEFPTAPRRVRREIASALLEPAGCSSGMIETVSENRYLVPALVNSAANFARMVGGTQCPPDDSVRAHTTALLKAMGRNATAQIAQRATRFDLRYLNVQGNASAQRVLESLGVIKQATLLMSGPPGTGKTQFAAEIARQGGRELVYRTAADINSMWYGESERNVARMFQECDAASELLFVDEADTLLGSRTADGGRADRAVTSEFLRHIESFEGLFVCATNHARFLDPALMRRFTFRMSFLPLGSAQRYAMFCELAAAWDPAGQAPMPTLDTLDASRLARLDQLTPGDFANVAKRVRILKLELAPGQWLDELEAEHAAKPDGERAPMGFV